MRYPVVVERGTEREAYGVTVPDLPGCFSAGDTFETALWNAREAIELHLEGLLDRGELLPLPNVELHASMFARRSAILAVVDVPVDALDDRVELVQLAMPGRVLRAIDAAATKQGISRSAFLAEAALRKARDLLDTPPRAE